MEKACHDRDANPYVGVSRPRSWSHLPILGAISWAFIAKYWQRLWKIDFEIPPRRALGGPEHSRAIGLPLAPHGGLSRERFAHMHV